jgi:hypothetical protein
MASNNSDAPTFYAESSSTPDPSLSSLTLQRAGTRAVTQVNLTHVLSGVTLDNNNCYMPTATNNPLFDSFTIELDGTTAILSVFQITISSRHGGSAEGYPLIRKVMKHVNELWEATVKVKYFLVCPGPLPEGDLQDQWRIPVGWNKNTTKVNHCGDAFCIRIPISGMLCLFTPKFAT